MPEKTSVYAHHGLKLVESDAQITERGKEEVGRTGGILRFGVINTVARAFCKPGRRIKLHPNDYYAMDGIRGIDERWFASTTKADNADLTLPHEGLSAIVLEDEKTALRFVDVVGQLPELILGKGWAEKWDNIWPMYSKFFDNLAALPHHIHHNDGHAAMVDQLGKPEAYFFFSQMNNHGGLHPHTYFGLSPEVSKKEVIRSLKNFTKGDNKILEMALMCAKLAVDTGWDVPPGVLHAPGSFCTYEPQKASDVFAMYQSLTQDHQVVDESLLWKDTPRDHQKTETGYKLLYNRINLRLNKDPRFRENRYMVPVPAGDEAKMRALGYLLEWICYKSKAFDAQRLTVAPGKTAEISDPGPYGIYVVQGSGRMQSELGCTGDNPKIPIEHHSEIRYGKQLVRDEWFVTGPAANASILYTNTGKVEPLVIAKHRGPGYPDLDIRKVSAQNLKIQGAAK